MIASRKKSVYLLVLFVILLGGLLLIFIPVDQTVLQAIGTSLVASGIIGLLDLWYSSIVAVEQERTNAILNSGLYLVYNHRDIDRYHSLMAGLSSRLDIAGYSLRNFFESFHDIIIQRINKNRNVKIRILVVDPDCYYSKMREEHEGHTKGTFANQIEKMKRHFYNYRKNIEIRKIDTELPTMIFRIDDFMYVGPYLSSKPSKSTLTYELKDDKSAWLFEDYESEFDLLWKRATSA